jgi:hypothetical protein
LVLAQLLCLDATGDTPRLSKCHEMAGLQEWQHPSQVLKNSPQVTSIYQ